MLNERTQPIDLDDRAPVPGAAGIMGRLRALSLMLSGISRGIAVLVAVTAWAGPPPGGGSHGGGFHGGGFHGGGFHYSGFAPRSINVHGSRAPTPPGGYGQGGHGWLGSQVNALPGGCTTYRFGGSPYYFAGGCWFRPWNGGYLGCYPPIGLYLSTLPWGCDSFWDDGICYYTYQDVYYTDTGSGGYEVVDPPADHEGLRPARQSLREAMAKVPWRHSSSSRRGARMPPG